MATTAKAGQNAILKKGATTIGLTRNLRFQHNARVLDASVHGTDKSMSKVASLIDRKVMCDVLVLPGSTHSALRTDADDQSTDSYNITWPDASVVTFDAFVSQFDVQSPQDGMFAASCTFEVDGAPVWS